jgi:hypothetical protein
MKLDRVLLIVFALLACVGALTAGTRTYTKTMEPTGADAINVDSLEVSWGDYDMARFNVVTVVDSMDHMGWVIQASDDGSTWTTLAELTDADLSDLTYGVGGQFYVTADSTGTWYLIRPGSDIGVGATGIPGGDLTQARLLAFATHLRFYLNDIDGTDVTGPSVAVKIRLSN